jgi:hypothetical protein
VILLSDSVQSVANPVPLSLNPVIGRGFVHCPIAAQSKIRGACLALRRPQNPRDATILITIENCSKTPLLDDLIVTLLRGTQARETAQQRANIYVLPAANAKEIMEPEPGARRFCDPVPSAACHPFFHKHGWPLNNQTEMSYLTTILMSF